MAKKTPKAMNKSMGEKGSKGSAHMMPDMHAKMGKKTGKMPMKNQGCK